MDKSRVWLVTGSSSGFGRTMVQLVLDKGERVVATLRKPSDIDDLTSTYPSSQLKVLKLDVTNPLEITEAFREAKAAFGRVDVVFNNAGRWMLGEVEGTPENEARQLFDINFWGAANVSKEAVRFFREENPPGAGGRLLVTSSDGGIATFLLNGYYTATKFALEGITQTLSEELDPSWNIKITLVEPGNFRTSIPGKAVWVPVHRAYTKPDSAAAKQRALEEVAYDDPTNKIGDMDKAVEKIWDLSTLTKPPLRLPLGKDSVAEIRAQLQNITVDLDAYEGWSEDLLEN